MVVESHTRQMSEYNRAFKLKTALCASGLYDQNLDYRLQRRDAERFHQTDPFVWDDSNEESDSDDNCHKRKLASIPLHRYKHQKFTEAYRLARHTDTPAQAHQRLCTQADERLHKTDPILRQEKQAFKRQAEANDNARIASGPRDQAVQTPDWADELNNGSPITSMQEKACQVVNGVPSTNRVVKSKSTQKSLSRRPGTASSMPADKDRPPFVAYGFLDKHKDTGKKQTHNVCAASCVYPSALKALRRKQVEMEQKQARPKSAPAQTCQPYDIVQKFNRKMDEDTSCWQTEYGSHFPWYNLMAYQQHRKPQVPAHKSPASFYIPM